MYVGKAPCDDCRFFEKCKREEVACKQFFKFVFDGEFFAQSCEDGVAEIEDVGEARGLEENCNPGEVCSC